MLDFDPALPEPPAFQVDTSDLVFFLSWAFSARYGASHELSDAANLLRGGEFKIDMTPLLTFADRDVETPEDEDVLERSWQDALPLAECCARVAEALEGNDERLVAIRGDYPGLGGAIRALGEIARETSARGARIRITYELESD